MLRLRIPIKLQIALWYTIFLVVTVAGIGAFLLTALGSSLQAEIDDALRLRATQIGQRIDNDGNELLIPGATAGQLLDRALLEEFAAPGIYVQIRDRNGLVLASSANLSGEALPIKPEMVKSVLFGQEVFSTVPAGAERLRVLGQPVTRGSGVVGGILVAESLHTMDVAIRQTQQLLLLASISAALVSLLSGWWLTTRALRPIAETIQVAKGIARTGHFEQRVTDPATNDEVGELAATFNEMLTRLETTFRRQREFVADASHELRSPLAIIRGNLDLLKLDMPPQDKDEAIQEASEEVDRMARMVADLLFLAEVDAQKVMGHQAVPLDTLVEATYQRALRLDSGQHKIGLIVNDPTMVEGDSGRLEQLLWNLVANALQYTPPGGQVNISLRRQGPVAELTVTDSGVGIPAEHLPYIFDRFYRADQSRSRWHGGTGLGLAIVKRVVEAHQGQVRVHSEAGMGTTFSVMLPVSYPDIP